MLSLILMSLWSLRLSMRRMNLSLGTRLLCYINQISKKCLYYCKNIDIGTHSL